MNHWDRKTLQERLGASTVAIYDQKLTAEAFSCWKELGILHMEICGGWPSLHEHYDHRDKRQVKEMKKAAEAYGISIDSVHAPATSDPKMYDLGAASEVERQKAVDEIKIAAESAMEMSARILVCHMDATLGTIESGRLLADFVKGCDLSIVNENGQLLTEYVKVADAVASEQFGICIDVGHTRDPDGINPLTKQGVAYDQIMLCKKSLKHLHLHDMKEGRDHYPPFDGDIQWFEVFQALYDMNYQGLFMFESAYVFDDVLQKIADFPNEYMKRYEQIKGQAKPIA